MEIPKTFFDEIRQYARDAYELDRKRAIREGVELLVCFLAFVGAIVLAGIYGWGW